MKNIITITNNANREFKMKKYVIMTKDSLVILQGYTNKKEAYKKFIEKGYNIKLNDIFIYNN